MLSNILSDNMVFYVSMRNKISKFISYISFGFNNILDEY